MLIEILFILQVGNLVQVDGLEDSQTPDWYESSSNEFQGLKPSASS